MAWPKSTKKATNSVRSNLTIMKPERHYTPLQSLNNFTADLLTSP